jgi:hypothetical protein
MANDYSLLLRGLFANARAELDKWITKVHFASSYLQPVFDENVHAESLQTNKNYLSYILQETANKFGSSFIDLISFLRTKQKANSNYHLEANIKKYAQQHVSEQTFDLLKFIQVEELLLDTDSVEFKRLQPIFDKLCRVYNDERYCFI